MATRQRKGTKPKSTEAKGTKLLSHLSLEALTEADHGTTVRDGGSLIGKVRNTRAGIRVSFTFRFKRDGKQHDFRCGTWPTDSLAAIRANRDKASLINREGIDPGERKKADIARAQAADREAIQKQAQLREEALTVNDLYAEWITNGVLRGDGNVDLRRNFAKHVLPVLGKRPIGQLSDKDVMAMLRKAKANGRNRTAVVLYKDVGQMLRWGEKRQPWRKLMIENNPIRLVDINLLLDDGYTNERERVLAANEIRELRDRFRQLEGTPDSIDPRFQCAIWISLGTLCRIGELIKARWENVDLDTGVWLKPAKTLKGGKRGKVKDHRVYLSPFVIEQFKKLYALTGHTQYCLPKDEDGSTHAFINCIGQLVGNRQRRFKANPDMQNRNRINDTLVLSNGANGKWTVHDLRRTSSTLLQSLGVQLEVIDLCQGHKLPGTGARRHYLHHGYQEEQTEAWRILGEHIQAILSGDNVVPIRKKRK